MATKPDPLLAQAQAIVNAAIQASVAPIEAQRQRAAEEAAAQQQAIGGYSQAAAQIAQGIAPQVQQAYQGASRDTAAFAQGFAHGFENDLNQGAGDINAFLQKMGAPEGQMIKPSQAGDVLYGQSGYIPATSLAREGAAWTAASAQQPATLLGLGSYMQADARREASKLDREFLDEIQKLESERPGAIQKALGELRDFGLKQRDQTLKEELAIANLGISRAKLGLEGERVKTGRINAQTARLNAQLTKIKNDRNFNINLQKLGLQEVGLDLRAQELEAKKRSGGFTPKQQQDLAAQAFATARDAYFGGYKDSDGNWVAVNKRPRDVLADLVNAGVPFSIAVKAIQRFARSNARDGAPAGSVSRQKANMWKATLGWTRKGKK